MKQKHTIHGLGAVLVIALVVMGGALLIRSSSTTRAAAVCVDQGANDLYVDKDSLCGACSDSYTKAQNSVTQPWCTINRAKTQVAAGDTVYVQDGHYDEGVEPTISGTAGNPITFKALSTGAFISPATNLVDENFVLVSPYTNVYSIALAAAPSIVRQTHFTDILVQDSGSPTNYSYYFLKESDGPINLTNDQVVDNDTVEAVEGSWRWEAGTLYVHPYDDVAPSTTGTDLWAPRNTLAWHTNANYITVDGFKFYYAYSDSGVARVASGKTNGIFRNIYAASGSIALYGNDSLIENTTATHGHKRLKGNGSEGSYWSWTQGNTGGGITIHGTGNTIRKSEAFQNWNNMNTDATTTNLLVDGVSIHDSPNHCWQSHGTGLTVRNVDVYNCQDDFFYVGGVSNSVFENNTTFGVGIGFQEGVTESIENMTFRNNIHNGCTISYVYVNDCSYEASVTIDNSIFLCAPGEELTIEHCTNPSGSGVNYSLANYRAACAAGTITGCMTITNEQVITSGYTNVITGGRWVGDLPSSSSWDVHIPNASSPARNAGSALTSATTDYEGDVRPLGGAYDIGADEYDENADPVLAAIGNRTIYEQDVLNITLTATDSDAGDTLTFSSSNRPSGSTLVDNGNRTATFSWTHTTSQAGSYPNIIFSVTDGTTPDSETISITVNDGLAGCTPVWTCTAWSACASSLQTRSCSDSQSCGTDAGKPAESQTCDSMAPGTISDLRAG